MIMAAGIAWSTFDPRTELHAGLVSRCLEGASAPAVLLWALTAFPRKRIAVASAFGPGTVVLLHVLDTLGVKVPVIFVDTLHHFPETLEHVERVSARFQLDLRVAKPADSRAEFEAAHGARLWERDLDRYQQLTKVEPFVRALEGFDAYISGRRRDQAHTRAALPVVEPGVLVRINPLASWSRDDVWRYIRHHDLPYHPLHDDGYASIGDAALTRRVETGEHERAGRWSASERTECGIHHVRFDR
jgi:phosphoadenosine phosphosulfate reductase